MQLVTRNVRNLPEGWTSIGDLVDRGLCVACLFFNGQGDVVIQSEGAGWGSGGVLLLEDWMKEKLRQSPPAADQAEQA